MGPKRKQADQADAADDPWLRHPTPKRAKEIDEHPPYNELQEVLEKNNSETKPRNVLHWFRKDLRLEDNTALHHASQKAKEGSGSLITMFLHSPKDMQWHGTSPARSDFMLESLRILQKQLEDKHIPLAIVEAPERRDKTDKLLEFVEDNDISHMYANMEYEIDELRRDIRIAKRIQDKTLSFEILHDETVMEPLTLTGSGGGPIKVFTPYHKAWLAETKSNPSLYDTHPAPDDNDKKASQDLKKLFGSKIPSLPEDKQFESKDGEKKMRKLWPAGNEAGMKRLSDFLNKRVFTRPCVASLVITDMT